MTTPSYVVTSKVLAVGEEDSLPHRATRSCTLVSIELEASIAPSFVMGSVGIGRKIFANVAAVPANLEIESGDFIVVVVRNVGPEPASPELLITVDGEHGEEAAPFGPRMRRDATRPTPIAAPLPTPSQLTAALEKGETVEVLEHASLSTRVRADAFRLPFDVAMSVLDVIELGTPVLPAMRAKLEAEVSHALRGKATTGVEIRADRSQLEAFLRALRTTSEHGLKKKLSSFSGAIRAGLASRKVGVNGVSGAASPVPRQV